MTKFYYGKNGYWQEWIDLDDDSPDGQRMLAYFRKDPEKYIEEEK
jgi:hypothetical protein